MLTYDQIQANIDSMSQVGRAPRSIHPSRWWLMRHRVAGRYSVVSSSSGTGRRTR
jgi:hypothetical protein